MCMFGSTPAPAAPAPLTPPPRPPAETDPAVTQAGIKNKQKAALAQGMNNTVLTSKFGLKSTGNTANKTALGY